MKRLLPADIKALAMSAWLFYSERGFDAQLIHYQDQQDIKLRVTFEDTQELPMCGLMMHPSFQTSVVSIGNSDKVYEIIFPEAFL